MSNTAIQDLASIVQSEIKEQATTDTLSQMYQGLKFQQVLGREPLPIPGEHLVKPGAIVDTGRLPEELPTTVDIATDLVNLLGRKLAMHSSLTPPAPPS